MKTVFKKENLFIRIAIGFGAGILLGTFTAYQKAGLSLSLYDLLRPHIPEELPVAVTAEIGHGTDARAARIGGLYHFREN